MVQPTYETSREKTQTKYVEERQETKIGKMLIPFVLGVAIGWAVCAAGNYMEDYRPGGPGNNTSPYLKSPGTLPGDLHAPPAESTNR